MILITDIKCGFWGKNVAMPLMAFISLLIQSDRIPLDTANKILQSLFDHQNSLMYNVREYYHFLLLLVFRLCNVSFFRSIYIHTWSSSMPVCIQMFAALFVLATIDEHSPFRTLSLCRLTHFVLRYSSELFLFDL